MTKRLLACIREKSSKFEYKRKYVSVIKDCLIKSNSAINFIVTGLKYVGKSVILEQIAEDLAQDALLLNLSNVVFSEDERPIDFYNELEAYILEENIKYVLIDNVSLSEGYDSYIVELILRLNSSGISFVISGSSHTNLEKLFTKKLWYRSSEVFVQPFTFAEWLDYRGYVDVGVCASNPQYFEKDIDECKDLYKDYIEDLEDRIKEYLEKYSEFMTKSKGLEGYLNSLIGDTLISNSRGLSTETDCFNVDETCALLRLLSFKKITTADIDILQDDYSDSFSGLPVSTKNMLLKVSNGACIKNDKVIVKNTKNISFVLKRCWDFKLIRFYKRNQYAKSLDFYLSNENLDLREFLQDYNVILANLPLLLYCLEDIIEGVKGVTISDLLCSGIYDAFIETYIVGKYAIAFVKQTISGYSPINTRGKTEYHVKNNKAMVLNTTYEVDILDEYNKQAIEISTSNKAESNVYFYNEDLVTCIKDCVKVLVTGSTNENWNSASYNVIRISYPLFILLLELFDFGNIEIELDESCRQINE